MRQLLFAGRVADAEALVLTDFLSVPRRLPCYQTLGDLHLDFGPMEGISDYRHELNLDTAIATTTFTHQGIQHRREVFSSSPDQAIVIRITANRPGKISFTAALDRPANFSTAAIAQNRLTLSGEALPVNDNPGLPVKERQVGIKYYAELLAVSTDGVTSTKDAILTVANATAVTLFLDCATSFRYPAGEAAMKQAVVKNLLGAASRPYADLRARHVHGLPKILPPRSNHHRRRARSECLHCNRQTPCKDQRRRRRSGSAEHLLPVRPLPAHLKLAAGNAGGESAGNLERVGRSSVGIEVHDQHQHPDDLLAG